MEKATDVVMKDNTSCDGGDGSGACVMMGMVKRGEVGGGLSLAVVMLVGGLMG